MTSTNDGKDVKSNQTSGPKGKTYYIELYKSLEARLSEGGDASERTKHLCEAWRRVHSLCQHSAPSTHPHLLSWLQRHTARTVLQTEWQTEKRKDDRNSLEDAINSFIAESEAAKVSRSEGSTAWEVQLVARGEWFKRMLERPWDHPVLTLLLNPNGTPPTDDEVLEWLKEERGVTFVMRLHALVGEKCDDIAMSLANAIMERVRAAMPTVSDTEEPKDAPPLEKDELTFGDKLKDEAGFTADVWEMLTDIEFVLLHKRDSKRCIALAKQTPLLSAYHLIERLQKRLEISPREKRLWKNAKEVAILIAQVVIARCMMVPSCFGPSRTALYCCARLLARLLATRLPAAADALANQAPTARHLHTLAQAIDKQLSNTETSMKPYVCELYVRAITAGMNELERLKIKTEKEAEARLMEKTLASWFVQLGEVLSQSDRIMCECMLTAFSLHPSQKMYEKLDAAPQPAPVVADSDETKEETVKSEFGSWASDSRSQTNFVKTSETLNMKHTQNQANVMSTAIFNEGEALGLSPELCQDIAVLLSGPRVKTLSWDMDRTLLLENCRAHSEQTHGGTRVLTRELKYLNIDPTHYQHLPEEIDDDENDPYYGIERGYEHLVPEEIWADANDPDRTETASSSFEDNFTAPRRKKKTKVVPLSSDEDSDPLSFMAEAKRVQKKKERPHSKERSKERAKKKQESVDPLEIDEQNPNPQNQTKKDKPKKERKKKEKAPKVKAENRNSLASLIGVKVGKKQNSFIVTTSIMAPVTDSDYDSQGKCSLTSMNSEGNNHDGLHESLVSFDELKSGRQQPYSLENMRSVKNEFRIASDKSGVKIPSQTLQQPHNVLTRLPYVPSNPKVISGQSPADHNRSLSPNLKNNDVRSSLSKLLDIRRQRAAMEIALNQHNIPHTPTRKSAILRPDIQIQTNVSPKSVAIPAIPKSYIKNQHAEKMAEFKREVNSILAQRQEKRGDSNDSVIQYAKKSDDNTSPSRTIIPSAHTFASQSENQQSNTNSLKMTDFVNVPYDRLMAEIKERHNRGNYDVVRPPQPQTPYQLGQLQRSLSVMTPGQRDYQKFVKDYEQSKKAMSDHALDMSARRMSKDGKKEIMPISRVVPLVPNVITKPEPKTPQCAKQSTLLKKPETSLNTFSRLSYMHKNKQTETKNKNLIQKSPFSSSTYQEVSSELDQIIKDHQHAQMRVIQAKNEKFDRLQTRPFCANTANPQEVMKTAKDHPLLSNMLQKFPSSFPNTSMYRNESQLKNNNIQQKPVSPPKTSLSDKDQNDLLSLLRQQNKLNVSVHCSTNMKSKPSTSKSNNATPSTSKSNNVVTHNISSMTGYNSTSGQKQHLSEQASQASSSYQSILETKLINIISNTLIKQQNPLVNAENCEGVETSSVLSSAKSVGAVNQNDKAKKNITNKSHAKKNSVRCIPEPEKPEWQAVMSDLLKHKTPTRGPNALDLALNKSSFELAFEKSLREPSIFASKSSTSENNLESVKQQGKSATGLAQNVIITNKGLKIQSTKPQKDSSDLKKCSNMKKPVIPIHEKILKQSHSEIAKKLPQDVQRKQFTYALPKHDDPFISGIPNSDYDLLEELMDDDLRKEIGELSSDDDSYNAAAQSFLRPTKGNEKRVCVEFNKPLNDTAAKKPVTDMRSLNTRRPSRDNMQPATQKPVIERLNKMVQMARGNKTIKMPQNSEKATNYKIQDDICLITSTSQSAPAHIPTTPNTQSQACTNVTTLTHNQVVIDPNIYISAVSQQAPLQNVMLIGSELIYERYSAVQTPVHTVSNIAPSDYVAVNNVPNMTLYQTTQVADPVASPLIIERSITGPIINEFSCATILIQPTLINDVAQSAQPATIVKPETPVLDSQKSTEINETEAEVSNAPPEIDIPLQNKLLDGNKAGERKVLSEVQELAVNEKTDKPRVQKVENDVKKNSSANEERLKKKRLAIINRKITHRCRDEPIPLSYSPLPIKTLTISKEHIISEAIPLTYTPLSIKEDKRKTCDFEEEKLITQIKNNLRDLSDSINDIKSPATPDSNESKENKSFPTVPCRRILLRSFNKIIIKSNAESTVTESTANKKSKVKLKSNMAESAAKVRDNSNRNKADDKEASTPKRVSKRIRNKTITITKEEKTPSKNEKNEEPSPGTNLPDKRKLEDKIENSALNSIINNAFFDIETELLGSKISKSVSKSKLRKEQVNECKHQEVDNDIAVTKEAKDVTPENSIAQKTKCVSNCTTNIKIEKIAADAMLNPVNEKINDILINTDEKADDFSKYANTKVVAEKVSASNDFNVERDLFAAKKAKAPKVFTPQKTKNPEYTTEKKIDVDADNVDVIHANKKCDKIMNDTKKQTDDVSEVKTCKNTYDITKNDLNKPECDDVIKKPTSNKNQSKVSERPPCDVVIEKLTTLNKNESKISSHAKNFNDIKSVSLNENIVQPALKLATSEVAVNNATVQIQNTDDLPENIDLDMIVTCEEVKVSKITPAFENVKTARNISINAETNDIISAEMKENKTPAPSDTENSEKAVTLTNNNEQNGLDIGVLTKISPTFANFKTATKSKSIKAENKNTIVVNSEEFKENRTRAPILSDNNCKKTKLCSEKIEVAPTLGTSTIINNTQEIRSNNQVSNETPEVPTTNITANPDDDIVILDDVLDEVCEAAAIKVCNDEPMKKEVSSTEIGDVSDLPQSFKDSIQIEHLPSDDPFKKSVRVSLPNGRKFKAVVYGEVHVTFDTLFTNPSIKSTLLNGLDCKKLYTMNVKQITTVAKSDPSKILSAQILDIQMPIEPVEIIDLLSDDEDEARVNQTDGHVFETEYGKYKIAPIDNDVFTKHQSKLSRKSLILLKKVDSIYDKGVKIRKNDKIFQNNLLQSIPDQYVTGLRNDIEKNLATNNKDITAGEIVEIDDSSNDNCDLIDRGKFIENIKPDKTINELKNVLLKELGVEEKKTIINILQDDQNETNETKGVKKVISKDSCGPSGMRKLSEIPTGKSCPLVDLTKEEQLKITSRKCYIQLTRCDDLPKMDEIINRDALEQLSVPVEVSDDKSLSPNMVDNEPITITGDFSVLHDLDTNIVEFEARSSSPVIELSNVLELTSLDNKSLTHDESAIQQDITLSCEANWFTNKPLLHLQGLNNNVLLHSNIVDQNIKEKSCNSARPCVFYETTVNEKESTQINSVPSLMSLVLKHLQNANIVQQYRLLRNAIKCRRVYSLKRKSSSLGNCAASKVPKLNYEIFERKPFDCILASTVTLDSDTPNVSGFDFENDKKNSNIEISISGKSLEATKNRPERDNVNTFGISTPASAIKCNDNYNLDVGNKEDKLVFEDDCCTNPNDMSVIHGNLDVLDCDMDPVNIILSKENTNITDENYEMSSETSIMTVSTEIEKIYIESVIKARSPSPVIEVAREIMTEIGIITKESVKAEIGSASGARSPSPAIEIANERSPEVMIISKESDKADIDSESEARSPSPVIDLANEISPEAIIISKESYKAEINSASEARSPSPVIDLANEISPVAMIISKESDKAHIDSASEDRSSSPVIDVVNETSPEFIFSIEEVSGEGDIDSANEAFCPSPIKEMTNEISQNTMIISKESDKSETDSASEPRSPSPVIDIAHLLTNNSMLELEKKSSECHIDSSQNSLTSSIANLSIDLEVIPLWNQQEDKERNANEIRSTLQMYNTISGNDISAPTSEVETIQNEQKNMVNGLQWTVNENSSTSQAKQTAKRADESEITIISTRHMSTQFQVIENSENIVRKDCDDIESENVGGNNYDIEMRLAEIVGGYLTDVKSNKQQNNIQENLNLLKKSDSINENNRLEIDHRENETASTINITLNDVEENMLENFSTITDHEYVASFTTLLLSDQINENEEEKQEIIYVNTHKVTFLSDDETSKELEEEIVEMHSDEIVHDISVDNTVTKVSNDEVEVGDLSSHDDNISLYTETKNLVDILLDEKEAYNFTTHDENLSAIIDGDCSSQIEEQKKTENLENIVLDEKEHCDLKTCDESGSVAIDNKCFSQVEDQNRKTENFEDIVLDKKTPSDLSMYGINISATASGYCSTQGEELAVKANNLVDIKEACDLVTLEESVSTTIDDDCCSQGEKLELKTEKLEDVFEDENKNGEKFVIKETRTYTSKDECAENTIKKYLTLIGGDSEVLKGVVEYEDPEVGTCYVIPLIDKCSENYIKSNENTDGLTAIIVNKTEKVKDETIHIDRSYEISQPSPSIEVNENHVHDSDDIETQLAKIVGEPLMNSKEQNLETKVAAKVSLDKTYKTSYSVKVEAISVSETDSEDVVRQLMGTDNQDDINQKTLDTEFLTDTHIGTDENLKVVMPKNTYAKPTEHIRWGRKSLKRKLDISDMKTSERKYRKGKNIDYPKITAVAMSELAYAKEYKRLIDYCSTVKFSFAVPFHKDHIDVHNMLKSWPIKNDNSVMAEDSLEANETLFTDIEKCEGFLDPLEQSLSDEIISEYNENSYTPSNIDETNFSMGFGEGSGRVIQELKDGEHTFSAATLSDVKQLQPLLPSDEPEVLVKPYGLSDEQQDQLLKTMRFVDHLNLREKVRSFFRKTKEEFILDSVLNNKKDFGSDDSDWPFSDITSPRYIQPFPIEIAVNVVQVGQSPVSAAAQNPVTCDPRVTHVSNVSPQCSPENSSGDELQTSIKTEYTELTTANITLPLMQEYAQHHHSMPTESQDSTNLYSTNDAISTSSTQIKSVVKIELMEESLQETGDDYQYDGLQQLPNGNVNNDVTYQFNNNANNIVTEPDPNAQAVSNYSKKQKAVASLSDDKQRKDTSNKLDQIANAMNAAGISATNIITKPNTAVSVETVPQNAQSDAATSQVNNSNYSKSTPMNAIALQQALAQILPPPLNQTNSSENNQQTSTNPPVLHIVKGNNAQSVINKPNGTQLLHIVQNKSAATSNGTPTSQQSTFSGLSLVDGAIQQNGNQVLHIMNTGNQKNNNAGQLLKRVNLLTNLANVQGSNEQKMVQFVCKSADGKSIQLPHQRSMVLRLQPLDPSSVPNTSKQNEAQDLSPSSSTAHSVNDKEPNPQEMKSRSLYEENYAKFVQNGDSKPSQEKATSLPKFNQVFGKQVYQDKQNEMGSENLQENSDCAPPENNAQLEQINDIGSPPILVRKPQTQPPQAQSNLVPQIKQTVGHSNIQTMHGGVIYTRQIPVNLGNGQTINLITVPSTEMVDDSAQKQKTDGKFGNQEGDPPVIKIVPTNQPATTTNGSTEDNTHMKATNEANLQHNPQPQPVLTQMRIKLPMLSKAPQMVGGARVVRPAFFQIQRNVIGGANQQVYQQLVLTAAPPLGQSIRVPAQSQKPKTPSETQSSPESQMSSSTLEQLREFDMVLEQVKERSTVQPGTSTNSTNNTFTKSKNSPDTTDTSTPSTSTTESPTQVLYSIGNTQPLNMVNFVNRKSTITSTTTSSYARSPDSTGASESPSSSTHARLPQTVTSESCASSSCASEAAAAIPVQQKPKKKKSKPSTSNSNPFNIKNTPKPSTQKPLEDEQTTQRILYILAEYKEQVENSPDKDKPAPRRRNNPAAPNAGSSKRKKSSSGSRRRDMSPVVGEDSCRTMGSEDSSCGTSMGECNECLETHSPEESPRKVVRRLTFEQETHTHITQTRTIPQRNVIVADGQAFAVRGATGKPATTVLMPANYLLPVSMVKGGQQIAIVTNRGPKLLVGAGEGGAGGTLLFQRLIGPGGLKPVLARPGVRHIRLPTTALHNLQAFNIATPATTVQPPDSTASPAPATTPPDLVDTRAMSSPWQDREAGEVKPERENSSPEGSEPWNLPSSSIADDYGYEEIVRTDNMDRTVLDAIPDRYSPDMEAQRIFDKMFDSDSKKSMYDSRCGYDIDASDDDKAYHQVVQRRDGRHTRLTHVSTAAMRHKCAILEHELRLQKSLSEECEDLGVDSPSASELFPEAELLFAPSPAHEQTIDQCHTPLPTVHTQGISQPDLDDQIATDHLLVHKERHDELDINLDDVGEIVTVGEDGMTTIPLDQEEFARSHEEFARSHPNTTFHSEPEDGEIPPYTIAQGIKGRQVTFHSRGVPGTVVMAPQTTVISQATVEASGTQNTVKFTDIDNMINAMPSLQHSHNMNIPSVVVKDRNEGLTKFDRLLNESRELHISNTASAIVHSTGNGTQVIRRVHYETRRDARYLVEDRDTLIAGESKMAPNNPRDMQSIGDTDTSSSERHPELFWESNAPVRPERRRYEFSSDSDKCCKSPYDEVNSDSSGIGAHTRLDSVIKAARTERRRSDGSSTDDSHPPLRTYPPKRPHQQNSLHQAELDRSVTGKTRASDRCHDVKDESRRRASNRGVVKRGCHCCNGSTAPPKPKKSRPKKSSDYYHSHN